MAEKKALPEYLLLLKECLTKRKISAQQIATKCTYDLSTVQKALSGTRGLSEDLLHAILDSFSFTPCETKSICWSFYSITGERFTQEQLQRIRFVEDTLNHLSEASNGTIEPLSQVTFEQETTILADDVPIAQAVQYLLSRELETDNPFVYTNYPYKLEVIDELVYSSLKTSGKRIDFLHFLPWDDEDDEVHNLRRVFYSLRYCKLRYSPSIYPGNRQRTANPTSLYPLFFVTSRHVLMFSHKVWRGILLCNAEAVTSHVTFLKQLERICKPLAVFPKDEDALMKYIAEQSKVSLLYTFADTPCFGSFMDEQILSKQLNVPNKATWTQRILKFYERYFISSPPQYHTPEGMREFARSGRFHEATERLLLPASHALRSELLKRIVARINSEKGKEMKFRLLDQGYLTLPADVSFDVHGSGLSILGSISEGSLAFHGEYVIFLDDEQIFQIFRDFESYISQCHYFHKKDWTLYFLEDLRLQVD